MEPGGVSLKEPKVYSRRNFVAADFYWANVRIIHNGLLWQQKILTNLSLLQLGFKSINSYLDLGLRSNDFLKTIAAKNALANDEVKKSG